MSARYADKLKQTYWAPAVRRVRAMLSWRRIDTAESDGDAVTCLGREDEAGAVEADKMDMLSPVGLIARPEDNATVQVLTAYIGGDGDHPVAVGTLDHTRRVIISTVGLDADETIIYTSALVIKLTKDGKIEQGTPGGTVEPPALKSDVDRLQARVDSLEQNFLFHGHATAATGPVSPPIKVPPSAPDPIVATTPATITGAAVVRVE